MKGMFYLNMRYWKSFNLSELYFDIIGKRKKKCNDIFTFDIETTSIIIYENKIYPAIKYKDLKKEVQEKCKFFSFMYIWQFSINDRVYYGRTWKEFKLFLDKLESVCPFNKIVFVHNLSFEFQFMRSFFNFHDVMARKKRHVMKASLDDYNIDFRCSYMMSNVSLKYLAETYKLPVQKLVGDLDYTKIRNSKTRLSEKELEYCENDCLVVYYYIKLELENYSEVSKIPITYTGHVRREFRNETINDWKYKKAVYKAVNTDGHVYNLLLESFQGGYTHSSWFYTNEIIKNVDSFDFTSSYPFVMVSEKYPSTEFKRCNVKTKDDLLSRFAYILKVKFTDIKSRYYNNFISLSKCRNIRGARYDNGRIVSAKELEITLTDIDFKFLLKAYSGKYQILESYYSLYKYLPEKFINFILDKYEGKTKLKNVEGEEINYMLSKNSFNSLYGMSVTNTIRDEIIYENGLWDSRELSNVEILMKLWEEKRRSFLSFAYGVWVTAYARNNLLENVLKLDDYVIYCDTDSIKLNQGYDINIIKNYNNKVIDKLKNVSKKMNINFERFSPKDVKGNVHTLGLFEKEYTSKENKKYTYKEFITQGAKKYAYRDMEGDCHITVSGVPKKGSNALKNDLKNFTDNLVFNFEDTGKNLLIYNDEQENLEVIDYQGNYEIVSQKTGACLVPTTYILAKSQDYTNFLFLESSKRSVYKE